MCDFHVLIDPSQPVSNEGEEDEEGGSDENDEDEEDEGEEEEEDEDADMSPVELDDLEPPSDVDEPEEESKPQENQGTTLFVRNVQFEATEDELYTL